MINKLIVLADLLDSGEHKDVADFVDKLLKNALPENTDRTEVMRDWEREAPTKIGIDPMPSALPSLEPAAFEKHDVMSGLEIVRDLRSIFRSFPNPDQWDDMVKNRVVELNKRLEELL